MVLIYADIIFENQWKQHDNSNKWLYWKTEETLKMERRMECPTSKLPGEDPDTVNLKPDTDDDSVKPVIL